VTRLRSLRTADRIAPAGSFLGVACPIPSPEEAPLVVISAPMGSGKTRAIEEALRPLLQEGAPILLPSHRRNPGQALAERLGIPWEAAPGTDERLQGVAGCLDSWCPDSRLRITGTTGSGGVIVLDEWIQQLEHLLTGTETALADMNRRPAAFRTLAEQLRDARLVIAADAQMTDWGVDLLEALTGRRALLIASEHRPMAGRPLHCPRGFTTPQKAAEAFRVQWLELLEGLAPGGSLMVWTTAQQGEESLQAPANLAAHHQIIRPSDLVDVIDSTTPDLAAKLAADPDGFASRRIAEAAAQGGAWCLYCSPSISSGISFERWKPAAVIAYSGGTIAPEHVSQALARVRCPEVPAWVFAPETASLIRMGSGSTNPDELIRHLRAVSDPLLGALQESGPEEAFLKAWAALGAQRNRQSFAYSATIAGLLEREGWELQAPGPEACPTIAAAITAELRGIRDGKREAKQQATLAAATLTPEEAATLARRRTLEPSEAAALAHYRLAQTWGLEPTAPLSLELLEAAADGLPDRLRRGWLFTTQAGWDAAAIHDAQAITRLDPSGRPFAPDRLRVAITPGLRLLLLLGIPALLQRFAAGETIAATDPAVLALHTTATAHRKQLKAALGVSPGELPTGTLRTLLRTVGWKLKTAERRQHGGKRAYSYRAEREALPEGVSWETLTAQWLRELEGETCPKQSLQKKPRGFVLGTTAAGAPFPGCLSRWSAVPVLAIPWPSGPPRPRPCGFGFSGIEHELVPGGIP